MQRTKKEKTQPVVAVTGRDWLTLCLGVAFVLVCLPCCLFLFAGVIAALIAGVSKTEGSSNNNNTVLQHEVDYILESLGFCNISNSSCPAETNITGLELQVQNNTDILNNCNLTLDYCGGVQGPPGQNGTCTDEQCNSTTLSQEIQQIENILNTCGITNSSCPSHCWECELSVTCPARNIEFFSPGSAGGPNQDISFTKFGTGAFTLSEYGNYGACRGNYSVDFQRFRFDPNEITSAPFSVILNGIGNRNGGYQTTIANGEGIYVTSDFCFAGSGLYNSITPGSNHSSVLVGTQQTISNSPNSVIVGGADCAIQNSNFTMVFGRGLRSIAANTRTAVIIGDYNDDTVTFPGEQVMFSIGAGNDTGSRKNVFTVTDQGNVRVTAGGNFITGGTYFNSFWMEHEKPLKLKWGSTVKLLRSGKFRESLPNEVPDFVVVPPLTAGIVQNSAEEHWHMKYTLNEETEQISINPKFDPKKPYTPRSRRPQWHVVTKTGFVKILNSSSKNYDRWIPLKDKPTDELQKSWWYLNS